ncbi:MAG: glutamyl-tRNA reductase [Verrucomicrobiae bacterium]|nr:glutamyl-tRNA reductase [Verrucomicrobiae bacterium]
MKEENRSFFCWGISHHTAPIEFRESISPDEKQLEAIYQKLVEEEWMHELAILSTCNRFEMYGAAYGIKPRVITEILSKILGVDEKELADKSQIMESETAIQHLFAVTAGLDSQIVGEVEITGQVKHGFLFAARQRTVGSMLNRYFQKSFQCAKWIRSNTNIGKGNINVATVAVDLAQKVFGNLGKSSTLVIGAGDIAEKILVALRSRGAQRLMISNRTFEKAQELASKTGGQAVRLENLDESLLNADVILCSTSSPGFILTEERMTTALKKRGARPLCLLDLALPRDIDPALDRFTNVFLYNLDDLAGIAESNLKARREEVGKCHAHIEKKTKHLIHGQGTLMKSQGQPQGAE